MSTETAKTKTGKRQNAAKSARQRTSPKDLAARKRQTQAVTGGVANHTEGTVSVLNPITQ